MIIKAAWVLPITTPPIRDGAVRLRADRIVAVGGTDLRPAAGEPVVNLGSAILTPGLVNAHTHLELTCYAGRLAPGPFWDWLPKLVKLRWAPGQAERERGGVEEGAWQSLRAGVTCVGDISRLNLHWPVLRSIPIRKVCFVELLSLADDPPRDPEELRAGLTEVAEDPLLTAGVTPHAPYSVPGDQIRAAIMLAAQRERPWCTHWAETREECAFLRGEAGALPRFVHALLAQCNVQSPGVSPIEYLEQCTRDAPPGLLAHFNYAQPGDAARLAAAGHTVVYCPRAHHFFGHAPHTYRDMLRAGVRVAIGTDSAVSNENLALLEELRFLSRRTPEPPTSADLLRMVTIDAARGLGLHASIGSLEPGKQADLAAFPCSANEESAPARLVRDAPVPTDVWVGGCWVVRDSVVDGR